MIDIKLIRENPELVKENIKKKFQDHKLVLVDEVIELDKKNREAKLNGDNLRSERKRLSDEIGKLMKAGQKEEAGKIRQEVQSVNSAIEENEELEEKYTEEIRNRMMKIPNIIDDSVPIGTESSMILGIFIILFLISSVYFSSSSSFSSIAEFTL